MINLFAQKKSCTVHAGNEGLNVNLTKAIVGVGITAAMFLSPKQAVGQSYEASVILSRKDNLIARKFQVKPKGIFTNNQWSVVVGEADGTFYQLLKSKNSGDICEFLNPFVDLSNIARHRYVWQDEEYSYEMAWQPADPNYIRILLRDNYGNIIVNSLLEKYDRP